MKLYGYRIIGQCGREWFVPISMVAADYAGFRVQIDGMSPADAVIEAERQAEFMPTWFYEQWEWEDVDAMAFKVNTTGKYKTKKALANARGPMHTATIQEVYTNDE